MIDKGECRLPRSNFTTMKGVHMQEHILFHNYRMVFINRFMVIKNESGERKRMGELFNSLSDYPHCHRFLVIVTALKQVSSQPVAFLLS